MSAGVSENQLNKWVGMAFVLAIHGVLLYAAMSYKLIPPPQEAITLMVSLINPPKKEEPPPPPPEPPKEVKLVKEKPVVLPKPAPVLVAQAPVDAPAEPVAPPPPPAPIKIEPPAPPAPEPVKVEPEKPAAPVQMSELSVGCSSRPEPKYPPASRRMGEQGQVKLRVELDESGKIASVKVLESSGHSRLDNAGVATVKNWQCEAATRDGKPARAIATQVFDFKLE